jgi:hypothetical protein
LNCQASTTTEPFPVKARLLTGAQLKASLGVLLPPAVLEAPSVSGLVNTIPEGVVAKRFDQQQEDFSAERVQVFFDVAIKAGEILWANSSAFSAFARMFDVSCANSATQLMQSGPCFETWVRNYGMVAFRRPLTQEQVDTLTRLRGALLNDSQEAAFTAVLLRILTAPELHVISEGRGQSGQSMALDAYEIATRLSLLTTGRIASRDVLASANAPTFTEPASLKAKALELLASDAGKRHLQHFARRWLNLTAGLKMPVIAGFDTPDAKRALERAFDTEAALVVEAVISTRQPFRAIFETPLVHPAHPYLANLYGVPTGTALVAAKNGERAGILTRAGLLASLSEAPSIPHRGYNIYVNLFCGEVGPIPNNIDTSIPANAPEVLSNRDSYRLITEKNGCISCHAAMNGFGNAMENYDGFGRFRTVETVAHRVTGSPVQVPIVSSVPNLPLDARTAVHVDGSDSLSALVGTHSLTRACFALRFHTFVFGTLEKPSCSMQRLANDLNTSEGVVGAIAALTAKPEFTTVFQR